MVVPYAQGLGENCRKLCSKHGIQIHFREGKTIRDLLVNLKDRDTILQKSGFVYRYKCGKVDCEDEYIGESGRTFAERFKDHMKVPSPIHYHYNTIGHTISIGNFSIVGRKEQNIARSIKEAMLIKVNDPSLNRNIDKYQLPHMWKEVLVNSPELRLKYIDT